MQRVAPAPAPTLYASAHKLRFITAASLFDGHDASINIMRRILQASGAEVIHLGHNRSVREVADAALQEDVQGVALSSYQGGHVEYFKYLRDLLNERGGQRIKIFGGGGGVIVPAEIAELESYGITKIFSPEDGRRLGLQGMINYMLEQCDFNTAAELNGNLQHLRDPCVLARTISYVENRAVAGLDFPDTLAGAPADARKLAPVIGVTGPGGAGKSSLTDELCLRFLENNPDLRLAILAVDPTRKKTGGALLGDRIRMNTPALFSDRFFMRSIATRSDEGESVSRAARPILDLLQSAGFDLIILETSGAGQSDAQVVKLADLSLYVMTAEFGAPTQLEKIAMLDYADLVGLNKAEKRGAEDAVRHVQKQFQRNHQRFSEDVSAMPVYATIASRFNDTGVNRLYDALLERLTERCDAAGAWKRIGALAADAERGDDIEIIPARRSRYLSEISDTVRSYHATAREHIALARDLEALMRTREHFAKTAADGAREPAAPPGLGTAIAELRARLDPALLAWLESWPETKKRYQQSALKYRVRDRELSQDLKYRTLSGLDLPIVALPPYESWGELARYYYAENLPGSFPYAASVFPFRKPDEDPTRMFAGEGGPERTNARFHYLTGGRAADAGGEGLDSAPPPAARLSTAFDSVTLYGEDPDVRPDIYGKVGNAGVSVPALDDAKRLYSGFDLTSPATSVSMTINGPAPVVLAFFFNAAVDQQVERHLRAIGELEAAQEKIAAFYRERGLPAPAYRRELPRGHNGFGLALLGASGDRLVEREVYERIRTETLQKVRGTVQADILKEDQAQNTCIFSTAFALRMMGDMQEYFVAKRIRNFYSVSISGYHIAEAGANPITQLAFTLANGFTYVEYYLKRGLKIDDFAPNLSFFFSNGLDAEYAVIGRVARRIWAIAMQRLYGGDERSQKLKYHIQTSGRSLHAREIDFNDIRTTLQALYALYDNCNSLHTNAYDEAITTPTEESVRRAMAIQLIINRELGMNKNHNPAQGAYIIEELTALVEEAVLAEFDRLTERGGVPGAMETMYQRGKIQEESLDYEHKKHTGELPIVGVNTFLSRTESEQPEVELMRSTEAEKEQQIESVRQMQSAYAPEADAALARLKQTALRGENIFSELMETVKTASLGQISRALYAVGGSYRRSM